MGFGEGSFLDQENRVVVSPHLDPEINKINNGSGFIKNGRSESTDEDWRDSKVQRTSSSTESNAMLNLFRSKEDGQTQNMLCFSSPSSELPFLSAKNGGGRGLAEMNSQKQAFSCYDQTHGYVREGGLNEPLLGTKCPFSPSQWVELEHQALVYKYIVANVPIPSNLLIALKKTVNPYGLSSGLYTPTSFGWGALHLGYSGNSDPELGRCRRTDGKKWRCSRDAVTDQKYCDRHINRGRHRSRKLVERQNGQVVSSGSAAKVAAGATSASVITGSDASHSLGIMQNQHNGLQPGADDKPSADGLTNWGQELQGHPVVLGHNPLQKSSFSNSNTYKSELDFNNHQSQGQNPLHLFIGDFPKQHQTNEKHLNRVSSELSCPNEMDLAVDNNDKHMNRISMGGPLGEALNMTSSSGLNQAVRGWNGQRQVFFPTM